MSTPAKFLKIKMRHKALALVLSVIALSLFFEGTRQVKADASLAHWVFLACATAVTAGLLWVQAFWIYLEEKSKGNLKKRIVHFERIEQWLTEGKCSQESQAEEAGNCERGS